MSDEEVGRLSAQVDALQARCTELENERRGLKLRLDAARSLLETVLVDLPLAAIVHRLTGDGGPDAPELLRHAAVLKAVSERSDRLERDAWCGAADLARQFVKETEKRTSDEFVDGWALKFRAVLG